MTDHYHVKLPQIARIRPVTARSYINIITLRINSGPGRTTFLTQVAGARGAEGVFQQSVTSNDIFLYVQDDKV